MILPSTTNSGEPVKYTCDIQNLTVSNALNALTVMYSMLILSFQKSMKLILKETIINEHFSIFLKMIYLVFTTNSLKKS